MYEFQIIKELKNVIHKLIPIQGLKYKFDIKRGVKDFNYPYAIIGVSFIVLKVQKDLHAEALRFISVLVDNVKRCS